MIVIFSRFSSLPLRAAQRGARPERPNSPRTSRGSGVTIASFQGSNRSPSDAPHPDRKPQCRRLRSHALARRDQGAGSAHRACRGLGGRRAQGGDGHPRPQGSARVRGGGAVLDPRSGGGPGLCAAAEGARRRSVGRAFAGDAGVFREAAHLDRLEGLHQRPLHGRLLPHRRGHGARAQIPPRRASSACRPPPRRSTRSRRSITAT